ncbi:unnamed protein product [Linum trigynum]|uniref:Uncharacterized protein n=1 Tax=Linum trigynum TaxID=586398 RepID=A0AAV2DDQ1_9ROSI
MHCQWCESSHHTVEECQALRESTNPQEKVDFIENARRFDPYSNTYNEGWRHHPNFSWNGPNPRPPVSHGPPGFRVIRWPICAIWWVLWPLPVLISSVISSSSWRKPLVNFWSLRLARETHRLYCRISRPSLGV